MRARIDRSRWLSIAGPAALFALIATAVLGLDAVSMDRSILGWIHHNVSGPQVEHAMLIASDLGRLPAMTFIVAGITACLLVARRNRDAAFLLIAAVGSAILNLALKSIFDRQRPALWISAAPEQGTSFPSGHAMGSATLALALIVMTWHSRWRWPVLALSITSDQLLAPVLRRALPNRRRCWLVCQCVLGRRSPPCGPSAKFGQIAAPSRSVDQRAAGPSAQRGWELPRARGGC
ncbi:MAG: hypothetical protein JWM90_1184 [Thermoleophilia bacterium]|nr:hypothetical protein [Thermoleophilia bacterium]